MCVPPPPLCVVFDLMFAAISGDICNSIRNANGNRQSTALDSDCKQRRRGYREGGSGAESVLGLSITGSVPKSQTVHTQRGRERKRGAEREQVNAAQATSPSGVLRLSRTL